MFCQDIYIYIWGNGLTGDGIKLGFYVTHPRILDCSLKKKPMLDESKEKDKVISVTIL